MKSLLESIIYGSLYGSSLHAWWWWLMMMLLENQWAQGLNRWKYPMMDIHSPNHWARIKPLSTHNTRHYMMGIIITRRMMTIRNLKDIIIELGNRPWWLRDDNICSVVIPWRRNDDGGQIASCHAQQNCICCGLHARPVMGRTIVNFHFVKKDWKHIVDRPA